jgi:hypothetical protein
MPMSPSEPPQHPDDAVNSGAESGANQLEPEAQARIGQKMRKVYDEILSEPLPDRFALLLADLAKTERD